MSNENPRPQTEERGATVEIIAQFTGRSPAEIQEYHEAWLSYTHQDPVQHISTLTARWKATAAKFSGLRSAAEVREERSPVPSTTVQEPVPDMPTERVRWTVEEHKLFLIGLREHGNKWKKISEDVPMSKTPTQIASYAQKYFNRRNVVALRSEEDSDLALQQHEVPPLIMQQQLSPRQNGVPDLNGPQHLSPQQNGVPPPLEHDFMQQLQERQQNLGDTEYD